MAYDFDNATIQAKTKQDMAVEMVAALNKLDATARAMERKWGAARLPSLVPDDLAARFYNQHRKVAEASHAHDDATTVEQAERMLSAWQYLDAEATRLGAEPIHPSVWEVVSGGKVIAIVRDEDEAAAVDPGDRYVTVYTLAEIARLLEANPTVCAIKERFPRSQVIEPRTRPPDTFWERGDDIPFNV